MKIGLLLWFGILACFAQIEEGPNKDALEKAKALATLRPLSFQTAMWTADLQGVETSRVAADVGLVDLQHFHLTMTMRGSYKGQEQKSQGLLVADGTYGWRVNYLDGEPNLVIKTQVDQLLGAGLDSFPLLLTPVAWLEAITHLDLEEVSRNGEKVTLKGELNQAFQQQVPALRHEPSIAGLAIEIDLHPENGFPLSLGIQVEPELKAFVSFAKVETLDKASFQKSIDFVPPAGVSVSDKTKGP